MAFFREETARRPDIRRLARRALVAPQMYVLRGRIVTMNDTHDVIQDGYVCVQDDTIAQVGAWMGAPPAPFDTAPVIATGGSIYPGLIELHNHPAYNVVPMWPVTQHFDNRSIWRADPGYKRWVSNTDVLLCYHPMDVYPKAVVRFVECRSLLGGVTTSQGIAYKSGTPLTSYFEGLIRNVEFPNNNWPEASDYIDDLKSEQQAASILGPPLAAHEPFIIHLTEGVDATTRALFNNLQKPDGTWLIGPTLVAIHATALGSSEFQTLKTNNLAGIVWSPLSNFLLYGATTQVAAAKQAGLAIAIGSDWAPSGTKNLLGELKIAKHVSDQQGGIFSEQELIDAVTRTPAKMLGWDPHLGSIEANKTADLLVIDSTAGDPYDDLINADESNVVAVIIGGHPRSGRATIIDPSTPGVELIQIAKQNLVLDIVDSTSHPLAGVSLTNAITTITWALANLPEVARQAQSQAPLMRGVAVEHWRPVPDYESGPPTELFSAAALPGPGDVDPLTAEPLTAVDDTGFIGRIKANPNVPQWLKDEL
jgi:5-methylthioadenosine/S-adenosylhomocysteine deaminase